MDVVIIGNGKVGSTLASLLEKEGHAVTVIDNKADAFSKTQYALDIMCIEGNGAVAETQLEAGADKAGLLIACTPYDELNILCCLIGKRLGAKRTISRVRTPEYFAQMHLIRDELGLSMVINPDLTAAQEISRMLIFPAAAKVEVFEKGKVELIEHKLSEKSPIIGMSLAAIYKKFSVNLLICAVARNSEIYIPTGDFVLQSGDRISIAASHKNLEKFFRKTSFITGKVRNVMIVGGGRIALYLAGLLGAVGMRVKIIERDLERCKTLAEKLPKASVINGDGTDQELLLEEGIAEADSFIALTGMDEENILMAMFAKANSNAKTVLKINRDNYRQLASQLGLDNVVSPKTLTTGSLLSYVRSLQNASGSNIESLYHIIDNQVEAIEFRADKEIPGLIGVKLSDVKLKKNLLICAIIRKRNVIIPNGGDSIELGDYVVVISKDHHLTSLENILA